MRSDRTEKQNPARACPICNHLGVVEILHRQQFVLQDTHILPREYDVVACTQCGCVYADTPASQAIYDSYYEEMSRYESDYVESDTRLYAERSDWIEWLVPDRTAHIIDIGCGNGELLRELQGRGYSRLAGLDPSALCAGQLSALGIEGIQSSFFGYTGSTPYDCAILSGVLEHICDVAGLMQSMCRLLRKNGLLLVCVPDAARYCTHDAIPFDYFNIEHINHFDETSLLNLGLRHGMSTHHLWKTHIEVGKIKQPVIFCAYANEGFPPTDIRRYSATQLRTYVGQTGQQDFASRIIDALTATQEEIIVWGAGNFAARLLATTALPKCHVLFWVDNDKHKQGTEILGRKVLAPDALSTKPTVTVLIAAAVYGNEIAAQIRAQGTTARIVCLATGDEIQ